MLGRLGLVLHPDKTRVVNVQKEGFDFVGDHVGIKQKELRLDVNRRSQRRIQERLREITRRTYLSGVSGQRMVTEHGLKRWAPKPTWAKQTV